MKNATTRWIGRKAIGLFILVVLSPVVVLALGQDTAQKLSNVDPASLAVAGGGLLGFGLFRRKNP